MSDSRPGYTTPARLLHWSVAVLVLMMIPAGVAMIQEGIGRNLQNTLFVFHKNVGVLVLLLVLARMAYRVANPPPPLPADMPAMQRRIAAVSHGTLYALLVLMPVAGYIRVKAGGFPLEALDALGVPSLVPRSDALAETAKAVHYAGSLALAALVALHVSAAVHHGIFRRDGVFSRMWPPVRPASERSALAAGPRRDS